MHTPHSSQHFIKLGVVVHTYNPSTPKVKARGQRRPWLYSKFKGGLNDRRPCLKNKTTCGISSCRSFQQKSSIYGMGIDRTQSIAMKADLGTRVWGCSSHSVGGLCKLAVEKRLVSKRDVILWAAGAVRHMGTQQESVVIAVLVALENKIKNVGGQGMPGSKISE